MSILPDAVEPNQGSGGGEEENGELLTREPKRKNIEEKRIRQNGGRF